MAVLVQNREIAQRLLREREALGNQTRDEVWDGVTVIMPEADVEHDDIAGFFYRVFWAAFGDAAIRIQFRVNVSDRVRGWKQNYRVPDTSVFLGDNPARLCGTHFVGGPDFALEVVSPDDRSRDKLDFFAKVGTKEVLIVDRDPWRIELYQLRRGQMRFVASTTPGGEAIPSLVVPVSFALVRSRPRPKVKIIHAETDQEWVG
jgi:Uma2 family endonuclease